MIIFLYGEDSFRSREKLKELKEKYIKEVDPQGTSLTMLDGEKVSIQQFSELAGPATLLAKKRMVIIESIFSAKEPTILEKICHYLEAKKLTDNIIIFWDAKIKIKKTKNKEEAVKIDIAGRERPLSKQQRQLFKFLIKLKYTQQFNLLSNTESIAWTKKEVEKRGGKITQQAAMLLTSLVGADLWQVSNEINKLLSYKLGREPKLTKGGEAVTIEAEDVEMLVRGSFDENIFALTDAISNRNKAIATKLLEEQIEAGLTDSYLVNMIVRQFRILLQIRQGLDSGMSSRKMINQLKLHPFIVQKGINQVRRFNLATLKNILSELVKIDFKMKTSQANAKTMLDVLIARI